MVLLLVCPDTTEYERIERGGVVGCAPGSYWGNQKRIQRLGAKKNLEVRLIHLSFFVDKATEIL